MRPDAAPRRGADRLPLELHDLRPGRPGAAGAQHPRGAGQGSQAVHAALDPLGDLPRQGPAAHAGAVLGDDRRLLRADRGRGLRRLRAPTAGRQRHGLRRHDHEDGWPAGGVPGRPPALAAGVPLRDGRRVPGHQPCAVPAGFAALGRAPQPGRRRRPGPVDLRVPWGRHPQHLRVRPGLPRRVCRAPRAELPLDADDPRLRERGDRAQPGARAEAAVVGSGIRRSGAGDRGRGRARGGPVRRRRHPGRDGRRHVGGGRRRLLPDERAVPGARGPADPPGRGLPGDRRAEVLRPGRDQGRRRLPAGDREPGRRDLAATDRQPAPAGDRRHVAGSAVQPRPGDGAVAVGGDRAGRCQPAERRGGRQRDTFPGSDPGAPRAGGGGLGGRPAGGGAGQERLRGDARGRPHDRGPGPDGEPPGAGRRGPRVRVARARRRGRAAGWPTSCRRSRSTPTRTVWPRSGRR